MGLWFMASALPSSCLSCLMFSDCGVIGGIGDIAPSPDKHVPVASSPAMSPGSIPANSPGGVLALALARLSLICLGRAPVLAGLLVGLCSPLSRFALGAFMWSLRLAGVAGAGALGLPL